MFKKLRNRLLIVNTLIIAALVLGSFSVIYFTTWQNTMHGIDMKLDRALEMSAGRGGHMGIRENLPAPDGEHTPPEDAVPDGMKDEPPETRRNEMFTLTFTVLTDNDGKVTKVNMPFDMTEDFYSDKLGGIIASPKDKGALKSDGSYWAYRRVKNADGYVIAFTDANAEQTIMRNLLIILSLVALAALAAAFLISLFSANKSIKPVEESYNRQKRFVADASHELKTPLTTINTNADVLLSHEDSTIKEERKWLDYIKNETERMTKLTNDLLYLARLDHDEESVMLTPVSFSQAAESVILLMEAVVFEKDIKMTYDITPDLTVKGDAEQLHRLVMILLDNACKYTPPKGEIEIRLARDASDAVFTIRNSGGGISEEARKHIFERFYREDTSRARESGGYGLGLAIAHAIVQSHKGNILVDSEKNGFTRFTVKIPLVKQP